MKKKSRKCFIAWILTAAMVLTSGSTFAFADEIQTENKGTINAEEQQNEFGTENQNEGFSTDSNVPGGYRFYRE